MELMIEKRETCQVGSGTDRPCTRPATVRLQGVSFCERCACEQEAYFAIGEFTEAEEGRGSKSLAVIVGLMKKIRLRHQTVRDPEPTLL